MATLDSYRIVLYRQQDHSGWVAEVPAIPGCWALMATPELAVAELREVFQTFVDSYAARSEELPSDEVLTRAFRESCGV